MSTAAAPGGGPPPATKAAASHGPNRRSTPARVPVVDGPGAPQRLGASSSPAAPTHQPTPPAPPPRVALEAAAASILPNLLCPVVIDVDAGGARYVDSVLWSLRERDMSPDAFAAWTCADLGLPSEPFARLIAASIDEQVAHAAALVRHAACRELEGAAPLLPRHVVLRVDVLFNGQRFRDDIRWDTRCPGNAPETVARQTCADLALSKPFDAAIAFAMRRELVRVALGGSAAPAGTTGNNTAQAGPQVPGGGGGGVPRSNSASASSGVVVPPPGPPGRAGGGLPRSGPLPVAPPSATPSPGAARSAGPSSSSSSSSNVPPGGAPGGVPPVGQPPREQTTSGGLDHHHRSPQGGGGVLPWRPRAGSAVPPSAAVPPSPTRSSAAGAARAGGPFAQVPPPPRPPAGTTKNATIAGPSPPGGGGVTREAAGGAAAKTATPSLGLAAPQPGGVPAGPGRTAAVLRAPAVDRHQVRRPEADVVGPVASASIAVTAGAPPSGAAPTRAPRPPQHLPAASADVRHGGDADKPPGIVAVAAERAPRAINAFIVFSARHRNRIAQQHPTLNSADISRIMGEVWRNMPPEEREMYESAARAENIKRLASGGGSAR